MAIDRRRGALARPEPPVSPEDRRAGSHTPGIAASEERLRRSPLYGLGVVSTWLRAALAWAGGGARTAIGYGRFRADSEQTNRWRQRLKDEDRERREERERQEAMKSPEGRWRMELRGSSESRILDLVRIHLDKEPLEDPVERRAFAEAVMATGIVSGWRRGVKREPRTNAGRKILRERARLVQGALEAG